MCGSLFLIYVYHIATSGEPCGSCCLNIIFEISQQFCWVLVWESMLASRLAVAGGLGTVGECW